MWGASTYRALRLRGGPADISPVEAAPAPRTVLGASCAVCGAGMRPGAPWCTLCLSPTADPAPASAAPPAPLAPPAPVAPVDPLVDPLTAPLHVLLGQPAVPPAPRAAGWPCAACGHTNDLEAGACHACGSPFLSALAAEEAAALRVPLVGDLRELTSRQRGMLNLAVGLGVLLLVSVLTLLAGVLF